MSSLISIRQLSLAARASVRSYTSSTREGSVAASKEFGYVTTCSEQSFSEPFICSKKEKAHEGMSSKYCFE
jgi:hypothetical protein